MTTPDTWTAQLREAQGPALAHFLEPMGRLQQAVLRAQRAADVQVLCDAFGAVGEEIGRLPPPRQGVVEWRGRTACAHREARPDAERRLRRSIDYRVVAMLELHRINTAAVELTMGRVVADDPATARLLTEEVGVEGWRESQRARILADLLAMWRTLSDGAQRALTR